MAMKLFAMSRVRPVSDEEIDSVKYARGVNDDRMRGLMVLMEANRCYDNMERAREERMRNGAYLYGDQWRDMVSVDGRRMTEEEYIKEQGNVPLKNNLIRRLVRNVVGVFRSQTKEPICVARDRDEQRMGETMTTVLQYNMQLNRMAEVMARSFEEFLISGMVVHRKWYGWRNDRLDCWTDYVCPNNFFVDTNMRDFRGWDCGIVGEVHDVPFNVLCGQFASSREEYKRLAEIYAEARTLQHVKDNCEDFGYSDRQTWDFLFNKDDSLCRVIEVWRKESKARWRCHDYNTGDVYKIEEEDYQLMVADENAKRLTQGMEAGMAADDIPLIKAEWMVDDYWQYYYLSPMGDILQEGETPYWHKSHPYVFKCYPFINGEIHSFVADVIDQQRYVNRLITLYDHVIRASAKGVLLFPEDCQSADQRWEDVLDAWSRPDGVIKIKRNATNMPVQMAANATNVGINELLNLQLRFFEDISGVHGALQGRSAVSGTSGSLYAQQAQNSSTSLLDMLDCFSDFVTEGAMKDCKNIQQYYDSKRVVNIAGNDAYVEYDPQKIRDVEYDISITEATTTPAYRELANDFLMQIYQKGGATLEQVLQVGKFPFGDKLLQLLQSQKQQMEAGQMPQGVPAELMAEANGVADMDAVEKARGMMM